MNGTPEAETGTVENSLRFVDNGDDYFMFDWFRIKDKDGVHSYTVSYV